jgi:hypothetical protein
MNDVSGPLAKDHPLMVAWNEWKASPHYGSALTWAQHFAIQPTADGKLTVSHQHTEGSLWAAFMMGFKAGGGDITAR